MRDIRTFRQGINLLLPPQTAFPVAVMDILLNNPTLASVARIASTVVAALALVAAIVSY